MVPVEVKLGEGRELTDLCGEAAQLVPVEVKLGEGRELTDLSGEADELQSLQIEHPVPTKCFDAS